MILGEILSSLNILEKLGKLWQWFNAKRNPPAESIASRFVRLFESHGVHRNQIPRFFGHGLTIKDVQDDNALLAKLDEQMLDAACEKFAVRREWLDGADQQPHPTHDFYKTPEHFAHFLDKVLASEELSHVRGRVLAPDEVSFSANALLILQEPIGYIGEKEIYRFHLCNNWAYTYWKARAYLTACVAIAWKRKVYIQGTTMPVNEIRRLEAGNTLLGWSGEGIWELGRVTWHPEDMALKPDAFLKDVDQEENLFGYRAGLELWMTLADEGLMDVGFTAQPRRLFEEELRKYSSQV